MILSPTTVTARHKRQTFVALKNHQLDLEHLVRLRNLAHEEQNEKAEEKLRLERQLGRMLPEIITRGGDRKSRSHAETLKLADLGITKSTAHRWRVEASVPEADFERWIADKKATGAEITSAGLYRLGRNMQRRERAEAPERDPRRDPSGLELLERAWRKATPDEREAFLQRHAHECTTSQTPSDALDSAPSDIVAKVASELINAGFHAMARRYHPDAGGTDEMMKAVNEAVARLRTILREQP